MLVVVAAAIVAAVVAVLASSGGGARHAVRHPGRAQLLAGIAARRAYVGLFIGGENMWWVGRRPQEVAAASLHNGLSPLLPRGHGAGVDQIAAVRGGVVAHVSDISTGITYGALGRVVFIPSARAPARVIGRATMIAAGPSGRQVWLQTAVQPLNSGQGVPASFRSPTWAVNLAGRRLTRVLRLPFGLVGATEQGPLTQNLATLRLQLWNGATGRPVPLRIPAAADFDAVGHDRLVWDSYAHSTASLHVTDVLTGSNVTVPLPRNCVLLSETFPPPPASFDPAGRRLVLPLERTDSSGTPNAEALYVIDLTTRSIHMVPGTRLPLPAVAVPDTLTGTWNARGMLWVLAMSPYSGHYQLGFWTGAGPLHTFQIANGSPMAMSAPGSN